MENITWLDVIKMCIPVLTVILAGILAFRQMKVNNETQAINKWKDDFRDVFSDYCTHLREMLYVSNKDTIEAQGTTAKDNLRELLKLTTMVEKDRAQLKLLMNYENDKTKSFFDFLTRHSHKSMKEVNEKDYIEKFNISIHKVYKKANTIYNDKNYIKKCI